MHRRRRDVAADVPQVPQVRLVLKLAHEMAIRVQRKSHPGNL